MFCQINKILTFATGEMFGKGENKKTLVRAVFCSTYQRKYIYKLRNLPETHASHYKWH